MNDDAESAMTKSQLKDVINKIVLSQGNDFIKELLRQYSIKIGKTKKDFAKNLIEAVDSETLTQEMIELWLGDIEGWGSQHLYLFEAPKIDTKKIVNLIDKSGYKDLLLKGHSYEFPDQFTLSGIELDDASLSLVWHLGKESWPRSRSKDFKDDIDGDSYRFDAYRLKMDRSVMRFHWRFIDDHCVILIHRNKDIDHIEARAVVWNALYEIGVCAEPCSRLLLTDAVKAASKKEGTKQTRMEVDGGYVELKSTLQDGGIQQVEAVRHVRNAVDDSEFVRAQGMFAVNKDNQTGGAVSVEVSGEEGRIRIWAQCKREFVYFVIDHFIALNG